MTEQRKMITALFCDLVGSTELSGVLEPETLRSVVLRYFDAMRESIEAHGGTVEKFIGDAVMAVFGVPVVREDDARRAAGAALDMIDALAALNAELDAEFGSTLAVRIGVNSGEAVTSGGATGQTMVSGEAVNVAARLEQNAEPGGILIGPTTRTLLGAAARVEPVGALALKGKRDPVEAYRLLALAPDDDTPRPVAPLLGRTAEHARLTALLHSAEGHIVTLTGEAGTGKTRLLRAFLAHATTHGAATGAGRCHSYAQEATLASLADALRTLLTHGNMSPPEADGLAGLPRAGGAGGARGGVVAVSPGAGGVLHEPRGKGTLPRPGGSGAGEHASAEVAEATHLPPEAGGGLPSRGDGDQAADGGDRAADGGVRGAYQVVRDGVLADGTPSPSAEATWAAVAAVVGEIARRRPVVLAFDDLQWAPPLLLEGIARLREALAGAPVLLVCAGRPREDGDAPLPDAASAEDVPLGPLTEADARRLADALLAARPRAARPPAAAVDAALRRAEGNPLHLEQLLAMIEDGADPDDLPATVTALLAARIDALDPAERAVLDAGAVVGRRFALADVTPLLGVPREGGDLDGAGALRSLVRRGLIEPVRDGHQFSAGLLRDVAYRALSKRQRAEWHEQLAGAPDAPPAVAAYHVEQAYVHRRDLGRRDPHTEELRGLAARALTAAGRRALARADLSWSADLHERALAHCSPDDPWWTGTAQGLGETWLAQGRTGEGTALLRRVLDTAAAAHDPLAHAHARLQLAALVPALTPTTDSAAAATPTPAPKEAADTSAVGSLGSGLAADPPHTGLAADFPSAGSSGAGAASALPGAGLPGTGPAVGPPAAGPRGADPVAGVPVTARRGADPVANVASPRSVADVPAADRSGANPADGIPADVIPADAIPEDATSANPAPGVGGAAEAARAALEVFRAAGDRLGLARAYVRLAQEQQVAGRHRAAGELLAAALEHAVAADAAPERAMALGALGVSLWQGPTPAAEAIDRCRALLAEHGPGSAVVRVTLGYPLASLLALSGRLTEARVCLVTADRHAAGLGYAEVAAFAPLFAAGVEALADHAEPAERLLREAVAQSRTAGNPDLLATASRDLARLRLARGARPDPALIAAPDPGLAPGDAADDLGVRALAAVAGGDPAAALALARRAVAAADRTDSPISRATARLDLARAYAAAGHPGRARVAASHAAGVFAAKGHIVGRARALALATANTAAGTSATPATPAVRIAPTAQIAPTVPATPTVPTTQTTPATPSVPTTTAAFPTEVQAHLRDRPEGGAR